MTRPTVAILMATYNGARYLPVQLESLTAQTYPHWKLFVSDDGSTDGTREMLQHHQTIWASGRLHLFTGPRQGVAANFLSLLARPEIDADYYAFCDQDDRWLPGKLARALAWLDTVPPTKPALYMSRTYLVDAEERPIALSPFYRHPPSFANALVQNIAAGNTIVFNHAACSLLRETLPKTSVPFHDWWTYLILAGSGANMYFDPTPTLFYRQHQHNTLGTNATLAAKKRRFKLLLQGEYRRWIDANLTALEPHKKRLLPPNVQVLECFFRARTSFVLFRPFHLLRANIRRQNFMGTLAIHLAALANQL